MLRHGLPADVMCSLLDVSNPWIEFDGSRLLSPALSCLSSSPGCCQRLRLAVAALWTGETRDTAELGLIGAYLSDNFVPRNQRVKLFRTWGSGIGMLPSGGTAAWGNATWAPDDTPEMIARNITYGCLSRSAGCAKAHHLRSTLALRVLKYHHNLAQDKHPNMAAHNIEYEHSQPRSLEALQAAM